MHHELLKHMFPFPGEKGRKFRNDAALDIFKELFTDDEAEIASKMSFAPEPVEDIAARVGRCAEEIVPVLDVMAEKGLVYSGEKAGVTRYCLLVLFPGMGELQFMHGEETPEKLKLAKMFDEFHEMVGEEMYVVDTPLPRVLPAQSQVPPALVLPYEEVSKYINDSNYISRSICYCRQHAKLLDRWCGRPLDVCLTFGPFAELVVKHGFGEKISTEEALAVLDRTEEAGLVHLTENCREKVNFICNCCGCCCYFMRGITRYDKPQCVASSNFLCSVDEASCAGCEQCVERCYVNAISVVDDVAHVDADRCIGCGLCGLVCPTESLKLVRRAEEIVPKTNSKELRAQIAMEAMQE